MADANDQRAGRFITPPRLPADRPFFSDYQARTERRIPLIRLVEQRPTSPPDDL